ncbi:2OG-Fe(II) oxygenase [Streptomyces sp. NPDC092296]|uniref:2OG-Fe(II) oxygenase n=1 Tax=Streptomyces sp. NPDC092296 TaxID=3366012 RepID=UPI00380D1F6F
MLNPRARFDKVSDAVAAHVVRGLLEEADLRELNRTQPAEDRYERVVVDNEVKRFQLESLWLSRDGERLPAADGLDPLWSKLLDELAGEEFTRRLGAELDLDLWSLPRDVGLFTHLPGEFISLHHDEPEKAITAVLYFDQDWPADGGGHFEVRGSRDPGQAPILSLAPTGGTLIAFDSSVWHATSTVTAQRTLRAAVLEYWRVRPKR